MHVLREAMDAPDLAKLMAAGATTADDERGSRRAFFVTRTGDNDSDRDFGFHQRIVNARRDAFVDLL